MTLNGKDKRVLRALGHHLSPVVVVGAEGVTPGVVAALEQALLDHELVKVKVNAVREGRAQAIAQLSTETGAEVAQVLGKTALLFKRRRKRPKILAPPAGASSARASTRR